MRNPAVETVEARTLPCGCRVDVQRIRSDEGTFDHQSPQPLCPEGRRLWAEWLIPLDKHTPESAKEAADAYHRHFGMRWEL